MPRKFLFIAMLFVVAAVGQTYIADDIYGYLQACVWLAAAIGCVVLSVAVYRDEKRN
ncbi:MAG: hypothetical protein HC888_03395 [Candidatus Competibacteraceae bacterium]|nr:hypothetical protein [Candidatus Competibacteraceae bacterium]